MYTAFSEITSFLESIRSLFDTDVTFSPILPQRSSPRSAIRKLNLQIREFCDKNYLSYLYPEVFESLTAIDRLISRDGIHLSYLGVKALQSAVESHMMELFKYGYDSELNY